MEFTWKDSNGVPMVRFQVDGNAFTIEMQRAILDGEVPDEVAGVERLNPDAPGLWIHERTQPLRERHGLPVRLDLETKWFINATGQGMLGASVLEALNDFNEICTRIEELKAAVGQLHLSKSEPVDRALNRLFQAYGYE